MFIHSLNTFIEHLLEKDTLLGVQKSKKENIAFTLKRTHHLGMENPFKEQQPKKPKKKQKTKILHYNTTE